MKNKKEVIFRTPRTRNPKHVTTISLEKNLWNDILKKYPNMNLSATVTKMLEELLED